jgi:predicted RecB family nuclease
MWIDAELLLNYQRCRRRAHLDLFGDNSVRDPTNDYLLKLIQDSHSHQRSILGDRDYRQPKYPSGDWRAAAAATTELMHQGAARIYQGVLVAEGGQILGADTPGSDSVTFLSQPDILERHPGQSRFGDWLYVPTEIKLGKRPKQEYQVLAAFHTQMLASVQEAWPEEAWLILREKGPYSVDLWENLPRLAEILAHCVETLTTPQPPEVFIARSRCSLCHWFGHCYQQAKQMNHLSLLPGVTPPRYQVLQELQLTTVADLAQTSPKRLEPLPGFGWETAIKLVRQAAATHQQTALFTTPTPPAPPPTAPIELYFDIEAEPALNLVYLHGVLVVNTQDQTQTFHPLLAEQPHQEAEAWLQLLDLLWQYPDAPIFHFCPFEVQTVERLAQQFSTPRDRIKPLLSRFYDLHEYVTNHLTLPTESYALKHIARWMGFEWRDTSANGAQSIFWYAQWLESGDRTPLESILVYNEDDCRATHHVKTWITDFLQQSGIGAMPVADQAERLIPA